MDDSRNEKVLDCVSTNSSQLPDKNKSWGDLLDLSNSCDDSKVSQKLHLKSKYTLT